MLSWTALRTDVTRLDGPLVGPALCELGYLATRNPMLLAALSGVFEWRAETR